jgi:hypothetical protein
MLLNPASRKFAAFKRPAVVVSVVVAVALVVH